MDLEELKVPEVKTQPEIKVAQLALPPGPVDPFDVPQNDSGWQLRYPFRAQGLHLGAVED